MSRKRKTITVDEIRQAANTYLRESKDGHAQLGLTARDEEQRRLGVASLLEHILMQTGNYHGFNYIGGYVAGVTDESRREYWPAQH